MEDKIQFQTLCNRIEGRRKLELYLASKSKKDSIYEQQLYDNPKSILEKEFGIIIPKFINVKIYQEIDDHFYFVIPLKP